MNRLLVWDLPVRLFHWVFAGSFLASFAVASLVDDDARAFTLHMWLGGLMVFALLLRLLWGVVGSRHARLAAFPLRPGALVAYLRDAFRGGGQRFVGHNPGSAWAVVAMFTFAMGLGATGLMMASGGEVVEELHEIFAWAMVATVGAHLAGIAWHTLRHRENIALSMIDGRKRVDAAEAIGVAHPVVGVAFLALVGLWGGALLQGYDPVNQQVRLPVLGTTLQLGEGGEGEGGEGGGGDDDEDDEDRD